MKIGIIQPLLKDCFPSLSMGDVEHLKLWHYHNDKEPTFSDPVFDFFEIAMNPRLNKDTALRDYNSLEAARESLEHLSEEAIEKEISKKLTCLEKIGCHKNYVIEVQSLVHLPADDPRNFNIGIVSYVEVAIVGEKVDNFKIFGFRT